MQTYDLSEQDAFKIALSKRGIIKDETLKHNFTSKECWCCHKTQAFANTICESCKRPLDRQELAVSFKSTEGKSEFDRLATDPKLIALLKKLSENQELMGELV